MGIFDFLTSTKRPAPGTPVLSIQDVRDGLLGLNRPTAPYRIVSGSAEGVDLIAEWKIVDAQWYEVFAKAGLSKVFRVHLKLDPHAHRVRAKDQEYTVAWSAGVPRLSLAVTSFKGQTHAIEFGTAYAFTETLAPGRVYHYRFDTREIKQPIQDVVTSCGWIYKGVAFGAL
ncbi:MAG TPA: hypothetical protein VGW35_12415 [Methylomirabilota bacterium]|jgi:hypothetical protein|nr:hypothetical protein [Methylomirabilota bacterium]